MRTSGLLARWNRGRPDESATGIHFSPLRALKQFFKIERASHYVFNESPGEVLVDMVRDVRPLYDHDQSR